MEDYSGFYSKDDSFRPSHRFSRNMNRRKHASLPYRIDRDGDAQMADAGPSSASKAEPSSANGQRNILVVNAKEQGGVWARLGRKPQVGERLRPAGFHDRLAQRPKRITWWKVRIPGVTSAGVDKGWVLRTLQENIEVPMTPAQVNMDGGALVFFINNPLVANKLGARRRPIMFPNGVKMNININQAPPPSLQLDDGIKEVIKNAMSGRFDPSTQSLNLKRFHEDPAFKQGQLTVNLSRSNVRKAIVDLIIANTPSLCSLDLSSNQINELSEIAYLAGKIPLVKLDLSDNRIRIQDVDKLKAFTSLQELSLNGNPAKSDYKDVPSYMSAVRKKLPQITKLDDVTLPKSIGFGEAPKTSLPIPQPLYVPHGDAARQGLEDFVKNFFGCFDGNRRQLVEAYAVNARFSLMIARQHDRNTGFAKWNRNLFQTFENDKRTDRFFEGRVAVIDLFASLPATEHILPSFTMEVFHLQNSVIGFTVGGLFREVIVTTQTRRIVEWSFSRSFMGMIVDGARLQIINDSLSIANVTPEQKRELAKLSENPSPLLTAPLPSQSSTSSLPTPQPSSSFARSVPVVDDATKAAMLAEFCRESGMNELGSRRALEENGWDYQRAGQCFLQLKAQNMIPEDYFRK